MPGIAEEIAARFAAADAADPADADALGDDTVAGRRRSVSELLKGDKAASAPLGPPEKRLRMRASVPVLSKYKGKRVGRKEAFGESSAEGDDSATDAEGMPAPVPLEASDEEPGAAGADTLGGSAVGGFSISGNLEAEYDRMMKATSKELEVMRKPSESELAKRRDESKRLKRQLEAWNSMVEFRIHLEGALSMGHRLPVGAAAAAFRDAAPSAAGSEDAAAKDLSGLLGELLTVQSRLAQHGGLRRDIAEADDLTPAPAADAESDAWAALDGRMQRVIDWSLDAADGWKERTRLESRKSFKVLDQSFRLQMQSVAELAPEKLRKRCTPPPGRHKIFGAERDEAGQPAPSSTGGEEDIVDDREFYVQLLREVLGGSKAKGLSDETKDLQMELQGRRAKKEKARAEVERRASKGRKIRYVPIEKLQNFMVPRPRNTDGGEADGLALESLGDGAVDALMRSMFMPEPSRLV